MKSAILCVVLLISVSCSIDNIDSATELESAPEFVQLTANPISQAFLSAISLQMNEKNGGFQKIQGLINELIGNNRRQLQELRKINQRSKGQCIVSDNKLVNRIRNFQTLSNYFRSRSNSSSNEKAEAQNLRAARLAQASFYSATQARLARDNLRRVKKWTARLRTAERGVTLVNKAIQAVKQWKVGGTSFIEKSVKDTVAAYVEIKNVPISFDSEMVEMAASDKKIRRRLFEWLSLLKHAILGALTNTKSALINIQASYKNLNADITSIIAEEKKDAKLLSASIKNYEQLVKNYDSNEKIYDNLRLQTSYVLEATKKWCRTEDASYLSNKEALRAQLGVYIQLKSFLRRKFKMVRKWLRRKYRRTE